MFDLTIYPLCIEAGREQYDLPGLHIAAAPRKPARMRAQDQLLLFMKLTSSGAGMLTTAQQQEILNRLAETYFTTPGSVTSGLRAVVTRLNDFLLNRNLRAGKEGQLTATLNLAALHAGVLFLGHGGPTHSLVLGRSQVQHFDDAGSARALGLSRQAVPRFYQTQFEPGDLLVVSADPPKAWTAQSLANSPQLGMEPLRRRLLSGAGVELQAAVVRFQPGKGQVNTWKPSEKPAAPERQAAPGPAPLQAAPAEVRVQPAATAPDTASRPDAAPPDGSGQPAPVEADAVPAALPVEKPAVEPVPEAPPPTEPVRLGGKSASASAAAAAARPSQPLPRPPRPATDVPLSEDKKRAGLFGTFTSRFQRAEKPPREKPARSTPREAAASAAPDRAAQETAVPDNAALRRSLASAWRKGSEARSRVRSAASKVLPKSAEPFFNLSREVMLLIAIFVPLVVVSAAFAVYSSTGRAEEYERLFRDAQVYVQQAEQIADAPAQRNTWDLAIAKIREAERFRQTDDSRALREYAQSALDELNGVVRLDFRTAVRGGFGSEINITRMVATLNDVFLLDGAAGQVLHLERLTTDGYQVNPKFVCGPGSAGGAVVGPVIDIAPLPINNQLRASIMGIDAAGNLVYCTPNQTGFDSRPLALPDLGWGEIRGMATYGDRLYVLDPLNNAVYYYDGDNGLYDTPPRLYFDTSIPRMGDVIDLAVDQEFLYMLHANGEMTVCESGAFAYASTRCTDPAPYGDIRAGLEPAPLTFAGTNFTQIQTTQPPDPSLFVLDEAAKSIYHLSLRRLNLQRQYRSYTDTDFPLPNSAPSAFAVAPNRRVLLAFGNQVFFASLP